MKDYIGFRVEPQLKKEIEKLADKDGRSLSNYIIHVLNKTVEQSKQGE